jgi:GntR family transcriptional regulator/MocR family aminotransferase
MAKKPAEHHLPGISLDPDDAMPLYRQLYAGMREAVLSGRLRPGQQLPPSRELAYQCGVSRNTVMLAFECLIDEGYISGRVGSGTFISNNIPDKFLAVSRTPVGGARDDSIRKHLSGMARTISGAAVGSNHASGHLRPFRPGLPEVREFPFNTWSRIMNKQLRFLDWRALGYGDPAGYWPLRKVIADYLRQARAVRCEAEQVIVVSGSQQALELIGALLVDPGEHVWMEDPGYLGARMAFRRAKAQLVPVPVDPNGLHVECGKRKAPDAKLVYVTPSHQYPLGVTMSLARRLELLEWARDSDAWIIEDDYDSEYRYTGRPIASLQGLDTGNSVIYTGTFSKVLFPALRLGYLVVPEPLVEVFSTAKAIADRGCPTLAQATLAEFISEGHFGRHIRRMRLLYHARQQALCEAANRHLRGALTIEPAETGLHVVGWLNGIEAEMFAKLAGESGVDLPRLSLYCLESVREDGLIMGYAGFTEKEVEDSILRMADLVDKVR